MSRIFQCCSAGTIALGMWFVTALPCRSATLRIGELELQAGNSATVPVELQSDTAVAAVQMDVLFDPGAYTVAAATQGTLSSAFRVDSHLVEPGRLRVVVGAPNNAALADGTVFRIPLTAVDEFANFFPVVLTDFALSTALGTPVSGKIAPHVRLLGLISGGRINGHDGVMLSVEAGATDGTVKRVEYFVGGGKIGESTSAPFNIVWVPSGSGPFIIQAIAYDSNGLQSASRSVTIVVTNVGTTAVKGLYTGLVQDEPFAFGAAGYVQFATTVKSTFTVKLMLGGKSFASKGKFAEDGTATVQFNRGRGLGSLTLTLQQFATNLVDQISGQLTDGTLNGDVIENATFVADVLADRVVWKAGVREPAEKGSYTVVLPAADDAVARGAPLGDSVGIAKVRNTGAIASTFMLADGTKASQGTFLSKDGHWPLFAPIYRNKGVLTGELDFTEQPDVSDFDGTANWSRPANAKSSAFRAGFETSLSIVGSRYETPERFERVLNLANVAGNTRFSAEDGGLSQPFERLLTINSANVVSPLVPDSSRIALRLLLARGGFSGGFIHPTTGKKAPFTGVIFQKQNIGVGYFPGGQLGGGILLEPNSDFPLPDQRQPQGIKPLPKIVFISPKEKARIDSPAEITITGTARSRQTISAIRYQVLYNGAVSALQDASGAGEWSINFTPTAGSGGFYKVFVKAIDNAGHESDVATRTVFYVIQSPLTVTVNGPGEVTSGFLGNINREIGATYTISAQPRRGHVFTGWTGSINSSAATITFTMTSNLNLQANFQ